MGRENVPSRSCTLRTDIRADNCHQVAPEHSKGLYLDPSWPHGACEF